MSVRCLIGRSFAFTVQFSHRPTCCGVNTRAHIRSELCGYVVPWRRTARMTVLEPIEAQPPPFREGSSVLLAFLASSLSIWRPLLFNITPDHVQGAPPRRGSPLPPGEDVRTSMHQQSIQQQETLSTCASRPPSSAGIPLS
jgi:hypothetical protein